MIVGLCGLIGSGKGTAGDILVDHNFVPLSFAGSLKDAVSAIFGWERALLEGDTDESRDFRERIDFFWSKKFGREITPRYILQQFGTECLRKNMLDSIWVDSLERKITKYDNVVITDVRFDNEIKFLKSLGASIIQINRGDKPEWYDTAIVCNIHKNDDLMEKRYPEIHKSEWGWLGHESIDVIIKNDGSFEDLEKRLLDLIEKS